MRVTCSKPFLFSVVLLFLLDHRGFYALVFAGILIHEVGHLLAQTNKRLTLPVAQQQGTKDQKAR